MIKFFRRVRRRLLSENPPNKASRTGKISRYLIYAIGEIILVVFGILIALQINTWNQYKKDRVEEKSILERIEKDLEADLADLNIQIRRNNTWSEELQFIIDGIIARNIKLSDLVDKNRSYMNNTYFLQVAGTYKETIASGKISLVINDTLRNEILKHYERTEIGIYETIRNQMRDYIRPAF